MNSFKFSVSLRFFGVNTDPDMICQQLGLSPKWKNKMGEPRKGPRGQELGGVYDRNYCSFKLADKQSGELHEFLEKTIADLMKYKSTFEWVKNNGDRSELFIGWYSSGNTGDILDSSLLRNMGELNIDLALDVYGS
ncbi:DUF4279 domain-containing protein [Pseudomonas capsici]|uniref:DUF4279 domain-containing protein n=1 Tax=Pseudomonas capsici TaxID=2810614 RepID=A0ABT3C2V8_9PSED|nr:MULTISPECIES: DUF4279 domain-containing protein [Pseudomonas]MBN6716975.1 DUF4279 domain-containing protein [Pseudomonas capsici]MBN6721966.1 DUF4279 domain-containing protein [Pseudomonas capsici]MBN6726993.1 DUF4279 domain-containing protein [Pseudomonas capsici]MBX8475716.1 DUF4279 domain-containing protein [Pseudomonas cichorii]MBX8607160.1 DUF4279 domain-containing protein [Pseudomonas cichorii]